MSDVYFVTLTATILLGVVLIGGSLFKYANEIEQSLENLNAWIEMHGLRVLAYVFMLSLALTFLAGIGII
jgi:hypothetical protein